MCFKIGGFLFVSSGFPGEFSGAFEGGDGGVRPDPLQIRLAVWGVRRGPDFVWAANGSASRIARVDGESLRSIYCSFRLATLIVSPVTSPSIVTFRLSVFFGGLQRGGGFGIACGIERDELIVSGEDAVSGLLAIGLQRALGVVLGGERLSPVSRLTRSTFYPSRYPSPGRRRATPGQAGKQAGDTQNPVEGFHFWVLTTVRSNTRAIRTPATMDTSRTPPCQTMTCPAS